MHETASQGDRPVRHSAKVFLRDEAGRYLLLRRSPSCCNNAGKWDLPGGKAEPGESFDAALRREISEETGLEVELGTVLGCADVELEDRTVSYRILEGRMVGGPLRLSSEHDAFAWAGAAELPGYDLVPHFRRFVQMLACQPPQS